MMAKSIMAKWYTGRSTENGPSSMLTAVITKVILSAACLTVKDNMFVSTMVIRMKDIFLKMTTLMKWGKHDGTMAKLSEVLWL